MVKKQCHACYQCAQTLPLSTRLTARPIWDKTKNKDFMKSVGFVRPLARNCNPMFGLRPVIIQKLIFLEKVGFHEIRNERPVARNGKAYVCVLVAPEFVQRLKPF